MAQNFPQKPLDQDIWGESGKAVQNGFRRFAPILVGLTHAPSSEGGEGPSPPCLLHTALGGAGKCVVADCSASDYTGDVFAKAGAPPSPGQCGTFQV